jgi:murein L,D-transpeptidase YafK
MNRIRISILSAFLIVIIILFVCFTLDSKGAIIVSPLINKVFLANTTQTVNTVATTTNATTTNATTISSPASTGKAAEALKQEENNIQNSATPIPATPTPTPTPATIEKSFSEILKEKGIKNLKNGLKILIDKSDQTLSLVYNGTSLKSYHAEFGEGRMKDKEVEGDKKTPEGTFYVCNKSVMNPPDHYLGSRWLGISYPTIEDADRGIQENLISKQTHDDIVNVFNNMGIPAQNTALGGNIGIHGGSIPSFGSNWTLGCIGLANADIEDFYDFISVGTRITIER